MKNKKNRRNINKSINIKIITAFILGAIISITSSYAIAQTLIKSADVSYVDNAKLGATNVQSAIDGTCTKFSTELQSFLLKVYPVGSIYISYNSTNPGTLFGGTWENYGNGRVLKGINSGTAGQTGGNATTTLKEENMPSHSHSIPQLSGSTSEAGAHTPSGSISTKELIGTIADVGYQEREVMGSASGIVSKGIGIRSYAAFVYDSNNGDPLKTGLYDFDDGFTINATHNHIFTGTAVAAHSHKVTTTASTTGTAGSANPTAISVQDPYITVYMWRRTK